MPRIKVNTTALREFQNQIGESENTLRQIQASYLYQNMRVDSDLYADSIISSKLNKIRQDLEKEVKVVAGLKEYLDIAILKYDRTDASSNIEPKKGTHGGTGGKIDYKILNPTFYKKFSTVVKKPEHTFRKFEISLDRTPWGNGEKSKKIKEFNDKFQDNNFDKDESGKKKEDFSKQIATVFEHKEYAFNVEGCVQGVKGTIKIDNPLLSKVHITDSYDVKAVTGEAHASWNAGLYGYTKDADGNKKFYISPSISAEVGASISALSIDNELRQSLGNHFGVYRKDTIKVLSAEAKAKAEFSFKGDKVLDLSADADLAKWEVAQGATIADVDIGVKAAVKVGIGAHLKAGWTDGKFKFDMGAAIGVGADIGFEVDTSKVVAAVKDTFGEPLVKVFDEGVSAAKDVGEYVYGGVKNIVKDTTKAIHDISKSPEVKAVTGAVTEFAENTGKKIDNTVKTVGKTVDNTVKNVGKAVDNTKKAVASTAKSAYNNVTKSAKSAKSAFDAVTKIF